MFKRIISAVLAAVMFITCVPAVIMSADNTISFTDVKEDAWYYADVIEIATKGIMKGTSVSAFSPTETLSRAMCVTVLYRMTGEPSVDGINHTFSDVPIDEWYTDAVTWAYASGITTGKTETSFAPNDEISRAEFTVLLSRYAYYAELDLPIKREGCLADSMLTPTYAKTPERLLYQAEIINGLPGNKFVYFMPISRAEAAAMIHRFYENTVPLDPDKYTDVVFIGNSITGSGRTDEHFEALGKERNIKAHEYTEGDALLKLHYEWLNSEYMSPYINIVQEAEYVVFQEFAGAYPTVGEDEEMYNLWVCESFRGVNAVGGMMDLFGRDKEYYSFSMFGPMKYESDRHYDPVVMAKIKQLFAEKHDLKHVYVSDVASFEPALGLSGRDLAPDGLHPNDLGGYCIALIMYCEMFDLDPTEQNNGALDYDMIPGKTQAEKDALMSDIKVVVKEILEIQK